jgi:hypothetical protein
MEETAQSVSEIECPYCAENISSKAKKCKHCGEILDSMMRDLETLKSQKQNVFMNNAASSSSSASASGSPGIIVGGKIAFDHRWHLFLSILTGGVWIPVWILFYIFRNRNLYY